MYTAVTVQNKCQTLCLSVGFISTILNENKYFLFFSSPEDENQGGEKGKR